jgi:hypothetical protein
MIYENEIENILLQVRTVQQMHALYPGVSSQQRQPQLAVLISTAMAQKHERYIKRSCLACAQI